MTTSLVKRVEKIEQAAEPTLSVAEALCQAIDAYKAGTLVMDNEEYIDDPSDCSVSAKLRRAIAKEKKRRAALLEEAPA